MTPTGWHYNALGTVHGGVLATLADNALGACVYTRRPAGTGYTTQGINVTFLRPVTIDTGPIRCEGTALNVGRRTAYATAAITDLTGRLLAHATTTCLSRPPTGTRTHASTHRPGHLSDFLTCG
ncbi:PaaI family thioesterase [Streptomyces sp. NPDC005890]|uniref:PaaI family thioesterase n=1 Tax=Streptomyces sp. NPDC005890 TaxID=3154568 RepID=UPI0033F43496